MNHRGQLDAIANQLRCRIQWDSIESVGYTYEDHVIYNRFMSSYEFKDMCHELAHYMLCSSSRRKLPDFGLGMAPDTVGRHHLSAVLTPKNCNREEERASLLGICLWSQLGASEDDVEQVLDEHSWLIISDSDDSVSKRRGLFWKTITDLNRLGFLDGNRVTFKMAGT